MSQDAVYFNVWFSACYMRLRERLSYYDLDEDAFHDTYLLVREKALCSVGGIADFEAYFRACYRHAVLHRHRTPRRDVHPGTGFFLRLCDEGPTVPEEELGACERLVLDILAFIRRSLPARGLPPSSCCCLLRRPLVRAVTACWRSMPGHTLGGRREVNGRRARPCATKPTFRTANAIRPAAAVTLLCRNVKPEKNEERTDGKKNTSRRGDERVPVRRLNNDVRLLPFR